VSTGKIIIDILIIVSMLFFATAYAVEDIWVYIDQKENKLWSVENDSINCQGDICRALIKLPSKNKEEYMTNLYEYNCAGMQYRILHTTKYNSHGNVMSRSSPNQPEWMNIIPESINGELRSFVCKKAGFQQKQQTVNKEDKKVADANQSLEEEIKKLDIITIQVGAFRNFSNAETLAKSLHEKGYRAYIVYPGSDEKDALYKVCIGQFSNKKEAKTLSKKIKKAEVLETFITAR
jgi:hypothetical protein